MTIGDYIDVGIAATVIVGLIGIAVGWFGAWYWRTRGRFGVHIFEYIPLTHKITRNIDSLAISYRGSPIKDNIALISGFLMNEGNIDITKEMIKEEIKLSIENAKWLDVASDENSDAIVEMKNSYITVDVTLLKRKEFITFKAILEDTIPNQEKETIQRRLRVTSRIANTQIYLMRRFDNRYNGIVIALLVPILWMAIVTIAPLSDRVKYQYTTEEGTKIEEIRIVPRDDGQLDIVEMVLEEPNWRNM